MFLEKFLQRARKQANKNSRQLKDFHLLHDFGIQTTLDQVNKSMSDLLT